MKREPGSRWLAHSSFHWGRDGLVHRAPAGKLAAMARLDSTFLDLVGDFLLGDRTTASSRTHLGVDCRSLRRLIDFNDRFWPLAACCLSENPSI